jgi:hypothetical protein
MKNYLQSLAAYLTGWVIAQNLYQRLIAQSQEEFKREVAAYVVDEIEARLEGREMSVDALAQAVMDEYRVAGGQTPSVALHAARRIMTEAIGEASYPRGARIIKS